MNCLKNLARVKPQTGLYMSAARFSSEWGSGAGKGGGAGGPIREAGGSFGKREAAQEEQYFRKLQAEQLSEMKQHVEEEITFHEDQIKRHQKALERAKDGLKKMEEE